MRTRQEIFDLAWNGLKAQGFRRSMDASGDECHYRSPDGLRCAIGFCIPDNRYKPSFESLTPSSISGGEKVRRAAGISVKDAIWASDLQVCHDRPGSPADVEMRLREFATEHSLTIPDAA